VRDVHVVVPDGIDDPARPSGGNTYDRHVCRELTELGFSVHEHAVEGFWSRPGAAAFAALTADLRRVPDGGIVLLDGLIASTAPEVLVAQSDRLRLVLLVHMPLGHRPPHDTAAGDRERERRVLAETAAAVVTTSAWAKHRLLELYALPDERVHVAQPGVDMADLAAGTEAGGALLCVAAVTFDKGHDLLLDALASIMDRDWHCACVGSLDRDPLFAAEIRRRSPHDRVSFVGPLVGDGLDHRYATADLLVLASRAETYGMVITEALARGVPVIATDVGGVSEALGHGDDDTRPGLLVASEDHGALGAALRSWLTDSRLRARLRRAARERRASLSAWSNTASTIAVVLDEVVSP
jgi:glycosyltransferase involved in cell wall biosynthesis